MGSKPASKIPKVASLKKAKTKLPKKIKKPDEPKLKNRNDLPPYLQKLVPEDFIIPANITVRELESIFLPQFTDSSFFSKIPKEIIDDETDEADAEGEGELVVFECNCCYCESFEKDKLICSNFHPVCKTCINSYVTEKLTGGNTQLKCIADSSCVGLYNQNKLKLFLNDKIYESFSHREFTDNIAKADVKNLFTCSKCCIYSIILDGDYISNFKDAPLICQNKDCKFASCIKCKGAFHGNVSCEYIKKDQDIRKTIEEILTRNRVRKCVCGNEFIRTDGCNKMKCSKCGKMSCYICRKQITGYDHFGTFAGCSTWTNETSVIKQSLTTSAKEIHALYAKDPMKLTEAYNIVCELEKDNKKIIDDIFSPGFFSKCVIL